MFSESVWVFIFTNCAIVSLNTENIILITALFMILAVSGLEFSIGFLLVITLEFLIKINNNIQDKKKKISIFKEKYCIFNKRYSIVK